jgi:ribosomal protein S18 acetylase RimI-like enzyme
MTPSRLPAPQVQTTEAAVPDPRIRRARESDVPAVVALVHELADYERAAKECALTEDQVRTALFGPAPALFAHVAEAGGAVVGCALWFLNFSTWQGTHGLYLEDLYVRPQQRGQGLGKALLTALAEECVARGYGRLQWSVLNWNTPTIAFYQALGAVPQDEWTVYRLCGEPLAALAAG